jgi:putative oxygen-independent coproporphyrinogen III oxidase
MSGIYIHIPFCKQACTYCDFHFSTSLKYKDEMVQAIITEIGLRQGYLADKHIETVYFGGGTPSMLSQAELARIFEALQRQYDISTGAEITLECNPDDLTTQALSDLKSIGINRLSIGLQSFDDNELKWMNRAHTASESEASVKRAQDKGFENITIDLIYGSKFQSLKDWKETLQKAAALQVKHISAYNLTIESKTKLGHDLAGKKEPAIDEEKSSGFFLELIEALDKHGFIHYEISNFGKEGFFSRHNSNYWKRRQYAGFGPSAHSFDGSSRQWNVSNNNLYMKQVQNKNEAYFEKEILSEKDRFNEYILTSLRTMWGVDGNYLQQNFNAGFYRAFLKESEAYLDKNLVIKNNEIYTLSLEGKLLADRIASDLFV